MEERKKGVNMLDVVEEEVRIGGEEGKEIGIPVDDMVDDLGCPCEGIVLHKCELNQILEIFVLQSNVIDIVIIALFHQDL